MPDLGLELLRLGLAAYYCTNINGTGIILHGRKYLVHEYKITELVGGQFFARSYDVNILPFSQMYA